MTRPIHVVTGAYGYSGKYIAQHLLAAGHEVRTLTNSPHRPDPFGGRVLASPLCWDDPTKLAASLEGVEVLYNTYWVRFNHSTFAHASAVEHTLALFEAARAAGVKRVVHTSITNPSEGSPLEYFRGKAMLERALRESGLSYAILRPAVLFGPEDILINNIAWALRRLPVFGVFGDGSYRLQPIHVDDFARLAVEHGVGRDNVVIDATGPETFTYEGLARMLGECIGNPRPIMHVPNWFGFAVGRILGALLQDTMLTWEEVLGLTADLLATDAPPAGRIRLSEWAREHADELGVRYASELARRRDRSAGYVPAAA